jgi:acyl carrier protein
MPAITAETRIEDSGIDSYGLIEIVFELEDELEIDIPYNANDGAFGEAETIGDLLDKLQALIEQA